MSVLLVIVLRVMVLLVMVLFIMVLHVVVLLVVAGGRRADSDPQIFSISDPQVASKWVMSDTCNKVGQFGFFSSEACKSCCRAVRNLIPNPYPRRYPV